MKHFFFSVFIACLILGLAELTMRAAYPERIRNVNYRGTLAYEFDPDHLMRLKKNVEKHYYRAPRNGGQKIVWKSNSHGFRGPELNPAAPFRIAVYGDSNIQARFSKDEDTYVWVLQRLLSPSIPGVEVVNAGVIGFGPDQALLKFEREVGWLQPDVVIFNIFCDNDYGDLIRNRLFEVREDGQLARLAFPTEPDNYLLQYSTRRNGFQLLIADAGRSFINRLFGEKEDPLKKEKMLQLLHDLCVEEFAIYRRRQPRSVSHFRDHYDLDLAIDPTGEAAQTKLKLMEGILAEIKRTGLKYGVQTIVQIQPSAIDRTRRHIISGEDLRVYPAYDPERLTGTVEEICRAQQLEYLNLFDIFGAECPNDGYFWHDDHWNDRGQEVAAQAMARLLAP